MVDGITDVPEKVLGSVVVVGGEVVRNGRDVNVVGNNEAGIPKVNKNYKEIGSKKERIYRKLNVLIICYGSPKTINK